METKPMNPSAFPGIAWEDRDNPPGMSLRDYFAAAVLTGLVAGGTGIDSVRNNYDVECDTGSEELADIAYRLADAMLKEREK